MEVCAAALGTVAFATLFDVSRRHYGCCALIGGAGWLCYLLTNSGAGYTIAIFLASVTVTLLSRMFAVRKQCPATTFLIAGIIPLVPGAGIYWTAYYMVTDQLQKAVSTGYTAGKTAVAIVLGIILVFDLPQKWFLAFRGQRKR